MQLRLRELRESRELSQKEVAASIGCSSVTYSRYENGQREPSIDMLIQLANYFGVSVDYLVGRSEPDASSLSDYEKLLVEASRKAEDKVCEIVLEVLQSRVRHRK